MSNVGIFKFQFVICSNDARWMWTWNSEAEVCKRGPDFQVINIQRQFHMDMEECELLTVERFGPNQGTLKGQSIPWESNTGVMVNGDGKRSRVIII